MSDTQNDLFTIFAVGDVSPNRDDPPSIFRHSRDVLRTADILFGQMEAPLSSRGNPTVKNPRRVPPKNVTALTEESAGFDVMSHACNHSMDYGWEAFYDTLDTLKKNNIPVVGAGRTIEEARKPVILERKGTKVGFLAYLNHMSRTSILTADVDLPGCAPIRASQSYQQVTDQPGAAPLVITTLFPEDKEAMIQDIKKLRPQVDVLVVSQHCGVGRQPEVIAMYQKEAGRAAVDAGADLVVQHHPHMLKGIEVYKGKVIFYGLGDFAAEHWLDTSRKASFDKDRKVIYKIYRVKTDLATEKHPYGPDSVKTAIAKAYVQNKKIQKVTYIPAYINPDVETEILTRQDPRAQQVFDYLAKISESQDLAISFSWESDEVLIGEGNE